MATVLAVDIAESRARILALQGEPGEKIRLIRTEEIELHIPAPAKEGEENAGGDSASAALPEPIEEMKIGNSGAEAVLSFSDLDIDSSVAVGNSAQVIYTHQTFPFRDQKKIDQVAPIQIQDSLPFEIDDFILDSLLLGPADSGTFQVLSSLTPKERVSATLEALQGLGIDPRVLTTRASALAALAQYAFAEMAGLHVFLLLADDHLSFAALRDGSILALREIARTPGDLETTIRSVSCSIVHLERQLSTETSACHVIASTGDLAFLRRTLFRRVLPFDLATVVDIAPGVHISAIALATSLGVASAEILGRKRGSQRRLVDFRQGPFTYRRTWIALLNALRDEGFYIAMAFMLTLLWFGGRLTMSSRALSQINTHIQTSITSALPGEAVPRMGEQDYLQAKVDTLEEELRGMGSLSSLSPLESLKELVSSVSAGTGQAVDVLIDSISIGYDKMTIRGSVADNLSIGNFSSALKARQDRFCDVKVDPKGKTAENRVGFTAEVSFCE